MLLDDVRHAFGLVQHETVQTLLEEAGIPLGVRRLIMNAAQKAKKIMGGEWGSTLAMTTFLAGLAQGCPLSALVFCLTVQLRIALVIQHTTPVDSDAGPLSQVSYMDDVTYLPGTLQEFRRMVGQLAPAGIQTHMHSSPLKAHGVAVVKQAPVPKSEIFFRGWPTTHDAIKRLHPAGRASCITTRLPS